MAKLRIGIIGAGSRGINSFARLLTANHSDRAEVVALAEPNHLRARAGLDMAGLQADIHEAAGELVERKDIDAVVVTSPDYLHEEHAIAALRNGKHVFVDKPMATSVAGCMNILEAAESAKRLLYMGFNLRHHAVIRALKELVDEGRLGEVFSIAALEHYKGGRSYHSRWNRLKKYSGGLWLHKGSHDFDVINHLMGDVRPARVSCFASVFTFRPERLPFEKRDGVEPGPNCTVCPYNTECKDAFMVPGADSPPTPLFTEETAEVDGYHKNLCMYLSEKDTHDQGVATVEYENGATATHTECFVTPLSRRRYSIDGTGGHAEADAGAYRVDFHPRWSADRITHTIAQGEGGHGGSDPVMVADFVECATKGKKPLASAADGTWSVAVACAAERSRQDRRVVEISELLDAKSELLR